MHAELGISNKATDHREKIVETSENKGMLHLIRRLPEGIRHTVFHRRGDTQAEIANKLIKKQLLSISQDSISFTSSRLPDDPQNVHGWGERESMGVVHRSLFPANQFDLVLAETRLNGSGAVPFEMLSPAHQHAVESLAKSTNSVTIEQNTDGHKVAHFPQIRRYNSIMLGHMFYAKRKYG